ncbi:MAG: transglycosylase family protein [Acidimicrobiales bacterium]
MSGSNPPSTNGSPCIARRAVTTSAAAVLAVALPVVLVVAIAAFANNATADEAPAQQASAERSSDRIVAASDSVATPADIDATTTVAPTTTTVPPPATTVAPATPTPVAPAPPTPAPAPAQARAGDPNDPASWDRLAQCESGGNWAINTGNGYYGGIQFSLSSWRGVGGTGYPHEASRETQIEMGKRLHAQGGWRHWPACTRSFGWR